MDRKPASSGLLGGLAGLIAEGHLARAASRRSPSSHAPRMETGAQRVVGFMEEHVETGFSPTKRQRSSRATCHTPQAEPQGFTALSARRKTAATTGIGSGLIRNITLAKRSDPAHQERQFDALNDAASRLSLPLHIIRGGSSDLVSEDAVAQLLELVPHAEYTDIAEATHMVVGDANDAFSAAILDFLKRNHSPQGAVT